MRSNEFDSLEEDEDIQMADDTDVYPENPIELNKWQNDPAFKRMFDFINKDTVLSNLTKSDIERVKAKMDLAYQCGEMGMDKAKMYFLSLVASTLNVNCSKDGFVRKQQSTVIQKKQLDITRQKSKRRFGKLW